MRRVQSKQIMGSINAWMHTIVNKSCAQCAVWYPWPPAPAFLAGSEGRHSRRKRSSSTASTLICVWCCTICTMLWSTCSQRSKHTDLRMVLHHLHHDTRHLQSKEPATAPWTLAACVQAVCTAKPITLRTWTLPLPCTPLEAGQGSQRCGPRLRLRPERPGPGSAPGTSAEKDFAMNSKSPDWVAPLQRTAPATNSNSPD